MWAFGWLPRGPVATQAWFVLPKVHAFNHPDHLNTPRLVADSGQHTVWKWDQQEPFGNNPADENPSDLGAFDLPLRLPGQRYDAETALHYNYFRSYDPGIGGYKESDPIGLRGGLNSYLYVGADPLRHTDLFGEQRIRNLPSPFLNELRKQLPEFLIEQGAKTATTPQGFGQAVGRYLCKGTGGRVASGNDACFLNGCDKLTGAGYEAVSDCITSCIDEIRKTCNPKCPI